MTNTQLVHVVQWLPVFGVHIEQVDLAVSVSVLATDQKDFTVGDGQCTAGPEGVLHANGQ